jgi:molybdopterin-guanine dinucleotide biosynthesis protein
MDPVGGLVTVPTILVTGPVGVGKTTLIAEMSAVLGEAQVPHAAVDFDHLTASFPRPASDDQWGTQLGFANLAAIWRNYQAAGARRLLIARVIEARPELEGFRTAVPGAEITVVRLRASLATLHTRLRGRGQGSGLQWHLDRAVELGPQMDESPVEDLLVQTEDRDPTTMAREILVELGWLT